MARPDLGSALRAQGVAAAAGGQIDQGALAQAYGSMDKSGRAEVSRAFKTARAAGGTKAKSEVGFLAETAGAYGRQIKMRAVEAADSQTPGLA
ncbi:hypothetical protein GALL_243420 [mine drainage metagenome]|uniref:Uncharacterized protein n=1 Tax=mine drainage metagenome TaxID=410659 RepID=A0A1J5RCD8_9ZZZZ